METFQVLVQDQPRIRALLEANSIVGVGYDWWKIHRSLILDAIPRSGSILDIGCANGFLLRCILEWSLYDLVPYGFDVSESGIREARRLLREYEDNFVVHSIQDFQTLSIKGLPEQFDIVYWHVWDNWSFTSRMELTILDEVCNHVHEGGRLILGFYDTRSKNLERVERVALRLGKSTGMSTREPNAEVVIWFDQPLSEHETTESPD